MANKMIVMATTKDKWHNSHHKRKINGIEKNTNVKYHNIIWKLVWVN